MPARPHPPLHLHCQARVCTFKFSPFFLNPELFTPSHADSEVVPSHVIMMWVHVFKFYRHRFAWQVGIRTLCRVA
jgi:hypothetical protein